MKGRDFLERFEEKINKNAPNGCWAWTSASSGRYGVFWKDGGNVYAHRLSYELHKGPITGGLQVCHTCDNGHCVNPDHLFLGTAQDNANDKVAKGRCHNQNGERNPAAKLTAKAVAEIRELGSGNLLRADIAQMFGLRCETVGKIIRGERWAK